MRHYEIAVILDIAQEERLSALCGRYRELIDKHSGRVHRFEDWGRRPLSYPIKGCQQASTLLYNIEAPMACIEELTHQFRVNDSVLRHMCIRRDKALISKSPMLVRVEEEAAARATRGGQRSGRRDGSGGRARFNAEKKVAEELTASMRESQGEAAAGADEASKAADASAGAKESAAAGAGEREDNR